MREVSEDVRCLLRKKNYLQIFGFLNWQGYCMGYGILHCEGLIH